jgi:glutaminyl-peptide cyclotransferase
MAARRGLAALATAALAACSFGADEPPPAAGAAVEPAAATAAPGAPERLRLRVLHVWPHDPEAFTQGLLWHDGRVYESTGRLGRSDLRVWDLESGRILQRVALPHQDWGEGLALAGDRLVQLTWRQRVAHVWSAADLEPLSRWTYDGEGWGLAFDGSRFVMSDGSSVLTFRDATTFAPVHAVEVTREGGRPVDLLNELELAQGAIWANVFTTDDVVRIDPASGEVTGILDASGLLLPEERKGVDVLNGIAYRPETGTFLLTGKLWPSVFEVVVEPLR